MAVIGYARPSTDKQDLTAQCTQLAALGVPADRVLPRPGADWHRPRPPRPDQPLAAVPRRRHPHRHQAGPARPLRARRAGHPRPAFRPRRPFALGASCYDWATRSPGRSCRPSPWLPSSRRTSSSSAPGRTWPWPGSRQAARQAAQTQAPPAREVHRMQEAGGLQRHRDRGDLGVPALPWTERSIASGLTARVPSGQAQLIVAPAIEATGIFYDSTPDVSGWTRPRATEPTGTGEARRSGKRRGDFARGVSSCAGTHRWRRWNRRASLIV